MSGRRLREAVKQELQSEGAFRDSEVVIAGLSNIYTHYITTFEEYQVQRYEGASTIYGPHTLSAYLQKYRGLARAIAQDRVSELPVGPEPPFFTEKLFNLLPAPSIDRKPVNTSFGDVLQQVLPVYRPGDVVSVTFVAGNPRNSGDIRDKTFLTVEIHDNRTNTWEVVYTDASWETRFHWVKGWFQRSKATVDWFVPAAAPSGSYRIKHFGNFKEKKDVFKPYEGTSDVFTVTDSFYHQ
ncbi:Neutral ceramidase [Dissostichus eleginoides]|uniref:Neutral ceramidase n=1 Tax=Dissostichus eleginoides TaxID=100907 RepID=A0AAD9BEF1_DISEL|nr:Neutral ceramidase [Dissostichus eleginoides]